MVSLGGTRLSATSCGWKVNCATNNSSASAISAMPMTSLNPRAWEALCEAFRAIVGQIKGARGKFKPGVSVLSRTQDSELLGGREAAAQAVLGDHPRQEEGL